MRHVRNKFLKVMWLLHAKSRKRTSILSYAMLLSWLKLTGLQFAIETYILPIYFTYILAYILPITKIIFYFITLAAYAALFSYYCSSEILDDLKFGWTGTVFFVEAIGHHTGLGQASKTTNRLPYACKSMYVYQSHGVEGWLDGWMDGWRTVSDVHL